MIVVDVETGGLNPIENPLLSIGAVEFENPKNKFYIEIAPLSHLYCEPKALEINGIDLKTWKGEGLGDAMGKFYEWLQPIHDKTLAGHNPAFDRDFCNTNFRTVNKGNVFGYRNVDLHSVAYAKFLHDGIEFDKLTSDNIYKLLNMPQEPRPHIALNGAIWETEALSRLIYGYSKIDLSVYS